MALPKKITYPIHTVEIPSTKKKIKVRPFTGKEEKLFLLAKTEPDNIQKIQEVIIQVISNCLIEVPKGFKVNELTLFDIEYIFLQLHAKSVDATIDFTYNNSENITTGKCKENCPDTIKCQVNIEEIRVQFPKKHDGKIVLYDNEDTGMLGIKLNWPTANILNSLSEIVTLDESSQQEYLTFECLEYFYDKDQVYTPDKSNQDEIKEAKEIIAGLTFDQNKRIREFFDSMPLVAHDLVVTCPSCARTETIKLQGLQDFFL